MLAGEDLVTDLNDEIMTFVIEALSREVRVRGSFFQNGIGGDHLAGHQVFADAEVFERTLGLRTPQLVGGYAHFSEAISLLPEFRHAIPPYRASRRMAILP